MPTTSHITPSCQYGFTDTLWRGDGLLANAFDGKQRNVFGGSATLYSLQFGAYIGASIAYVKIYDALSGGDGGGTLVAPTLIIPVRAGATPFTVNFVDGLLFATGVTIRATAEPGTAGSTDPDENVFLQILAR
jgi:hypothetical protein